MTDEQIEKAVEFCSLKKGCRRECPCFLPDSDYCDEIQYIMQIKEKIRKETAKEILQKLEKLRPTIWRSDLKEIVNEYGVEV